MSSYNKIRIKQLTTLRHQIGQMLIMGCSGTSINEHSAVANWLSNDSLGGLLLFDYDLLNKQQGKNLVSQAQIKQLTQQINYYANKTQELAPFIAVDYEGGAVDRLRYIDGCMITQKPIELANLDDNAFLIEIEKMAITLRSLGFNLNFAPVVDLNLNDTQGIIGSLGRSFSSEPRRVAQLARKFVEIFAKHGLICCYKHFPGHGSAIGDTHHGFVDVTATFQPAELEPYSILFNESKQLPAMVMTAHVVNNRLDANGLPATLSYPILTELLREKLKFKGVIISDDLQMQAISKHYSLDDALSLTINAGADMLIFANQLDQITPTELIDRIEKLVCARVIKRERIEQAYQRVLWLKQICEKLSTIPA